MDARYKKDVQKDIKPLYFEYYSRIVQIFKLVFCIIYSPVIAKLICTKEKKDSLILQRKITK